MLLGCRDYLGLPCADGGNCMPRYFEFFLHRSNACAFCQPLDTFVVHFGSISEYTLSRVNRGAGLLRVVDLGWEIVRKVGDSSFFSRHKFKRCSCKNVYINIRNTMSQLDIKHVVRNRKWQLLNKYMNFNILSIFLSDLGRIAGGGGAEEPPCPTPPTDPFA